MERSFPTYGRSSEPIHPSTHRKTKTKTNAYQCQHQPRQILLKWNTLNRWPWTTAGRIQRAQHTERNPERYFSHYCWYSQSTYPSQHQKTNTNTNSHPSLPLQRQNQLDWTLESQPRQADNRVRITNADGPQKNARLSKRDHSSNAKPLYTQQINQETLKEPLTKGGRHHLNPNHNLIPPPHEIYNRIYRTHTAKILNGIRTSQLSPSKHQIPQSHYPSPTFLTSYTLAYPPSESSALYSLAVSSYIPLVVQHAHSHITEVDSSYRGVDVGRDCSAPDTDCLGVAITLNTRRSRALCCEHQALRSRRRGGLYPHSQRMIKSRREIGARDRRREDNNAYRRTPSEQLGINTRLLQPEHLGDQLNNTSTPGFQPVHISVKSNDGSNSRATADRRQAEDRNSVIPNNNCPRLASHNQPHRRLPLNTEGTLTASNGNRMPIYTCGGRAEPPQLEMKPIQTSLNIQNRKFIPGTSQHPLLQAATLHRHSIPATESTAVYRNKVQLPHSTTLAQHLLTYSSKSPLNPSLPNSIYFVKKHSALSTLSYKSNPSQAWGTYAPGRTYAFISKDLVSHTKHSLNILHEIQLLNSYTILNKKSLTYPLIAHSNSVWLQLSPRNMTGPTKPHTRHHNSNHANDIVMDDITPPSKRTSPNSTKSLHKKSKSNSPIISLYRDPSQMEFWYGYPIMETIAYEAGIPPIPIAIPLDELIATGYVASEAAEL